jgi:trk system potassium uptake protein TrkA
MKIIIAGAGKIGLHITKYLLEENLNITIIDKNPLKIKDIVETYPVSGITGECTSLNILEKADIKNTDIFIAATPDYETNMLACQLAEIYGVATKIAMLDSIDYLDEKWQDIFIFKKIAIDKIISPTIDMMKAIEYRINYSYLNISNIFSLAEDKIKVISFICTNNSLVLDRTIEDIEEEAIKNNINLRIAFIIRGSNVFIPTYKDKIKEHDKIFIATSTSTINDAYALLHSNLVNENIFLENQSPNIIITGDNPLIKDLAIRLSNKYSKIKVVNDVDNYDQLMLLELEKHNIEYVQDDITNNKYRNNYLKNHKDIIIVMNTKDEDSTLTSIMLKYQNIGNIFTVLKNKYYTNLLNHNHINHIFSPDNYIMNQILINLRRGVIYNILPLYNKIEIIDFELSENSNALGKTVLEVEVAGKLSIISILNENDEVILFNTNTSLLQNYRVILACLRSEIKEVESLFSQIINLNNKI